MTLLILGLLLFLGVHSVRIFADDWRARQIARLMDPGNAEFVRGAPAT